MRLQEGKELGTNILWRNKEKRYLVVLLYMETETNPSYAGRKSERHCYATYRSSNTGYEIGRPKIAMMLTRQLQQQAYPLPNELFFSSGHFLTIDHMLANLLTTLHPKPCLAKKEKTLPLELTTTATTTRIWCVRCCCTICQILAIVRSCCIVIVVVDEC